MNNNPNMNGNSPLNSNRNRFKKTTIAPTPENGIGTPLDFARRTIGGLGALGAINSAMNQPQEEQQEEQQYSDEYENNPEMGDEELNSEPTEEEQERLREEQQKINQENAKKAAKEMLREKMGQIKKEGLKKVWEKLPLKAKLIIAGIAGVAIVIGVIVTFLILYFYFSHNKLGISGAEEIHYEELATVSGYCQKVYLIKETPDYMGPTVANIDEVDFNEMYDSNKDGKADKKRWEDPKEYQLDKYIQGVLQAEAPAIGDAKTYEAAAIVARTYALQNASAKCYLWDNTNKNPAYRNPQQFTTDPASSEITAGVSASSGVAMFINDALYDLSNDAYYDNFCYTEKVGDSAIEAYNYYIMIQSEPTPNYPIYGDWVDENVPGGNATIDLYNNSGKLDGNCQKNGLSLFGSKYLLNLEAEDQFGVLDVLKHYYHYSLELRKVVTPIVGGMCDAYNLHGTTLSREQFINAVNSYNGGSKYAQLAAMAGEIYDMSIANNFNPELVINRAMVEGYSGGQNNLWGLGASNGSNGRNYPTLSAGVMQFIKTMNGYNSENLYDVYNDHHYAFIGAKWFSPGSSKLGGCYYLPYISKFYTNQARLAEAQASCSSGSQIPTNDEDQAAYSKWQVEKMSEARNKVFGISSDCNNSLDNIAYSGGGSKPVSRECNAMISALFPNGIPQSEAEARQYTVDLTIPVNDRNGNSSTAVVNVHRAIANDVLQATTAAYNSGYKIYSIGGFRSWSVCGKAGSTCGLVFSQHCYGLAVDINPTNNGQFKNGKWTGNWNYDINNEYAIKPDSALVSTFKSLGWGWGGEWSSQKDYMHFSFMGT